MSTREVNTIIKKYAETLRKNDISFTHIYLFGSYAKGNPREESDIDVAVVVSRIKNDKEYFDKKMQLWRMILDVDTRIEPILLEKDELEKSETIMGIEVKKHGIKIV